MPFLYKRTYASGRKVWVIYYRRQGRQRSQVIGAVDKRTAERAFATFCAGQVERKFGICNTPSISLAAFSRLYLGYAADDKAQSTLLREAQVLKVFTESQPGGDVLLKNISPEDLLKFRRQRLEKVSRQTVNLEFRHLKAIFNTAKSLGYIQENPFDTLKPLRIAQAELPRFFELTDIARIRERFRGDEMESLVEFYLLTGVRLNEALSLRGEAVDLQRQFLNIRSVFAKAKKHRIISFANDRALAKLIKHLPLREDGYLFGPLDNQPRWSSDWVCRRISAILTELGYPWASVHTFRHTYISHLVMAGVPLYTVREMIGHAGIATTMRYAHLAPKHKKAMAGKRPY